MAWSPQQEAAIRDVRAWLKQTRGPQVFRLFGFAGTGKTTLARELASEVEGIVLFAAFTGKAALVLKSKGCRNASTIHSLIYKPEKTRGQEPVFTLNPESPVRDADLIVVDEVSMIGEDLALDLLSFKTKILVLGDPAQLPPVKGGGYFTEVDRPDVMLTEVHRQAADNPIIRMSMEIREGGRLSLGRFGESQVIRSDQIDRDEVLAADQVLVGRNLTRHTYNARIRDLLMHPMSVPVAKDKLVCLKNNKELGLLNGGLWRVVRVVGRGEQSVKLEIKSDDFDNGETVNVVVRNEFFTGEDGDLPWTEKKRCDHFTFGYALTVHKSQGSQWNNVYLFDESSSFREHSGRWLYTAVTRAAEKITIVI